MAIPERLRHLPDWPGRMTAPVAAAYMGISHSTFLTRFKDLGVREGGNLLWARVQLDRYIAQQFDIPISLTPADPLEDEYARWKARRKSKL